MTNDSFHAYTFDAEGNILNVDNGATAKYVYNALNQRVQNQVGSSTLEYVYDAQGRRVSTWAEPANTGSEGRIYSDSQQIAFRASDGTTYFDHQDYLGTERMRTNSTGAIAATYTSLPWGDGYSANVSKAAGDQDSAHFAGLDQDLNSANAAMSEHAQFRNYSFQQGRWLSPDPYDGSYDAGNPQSFNRYAYVLNNPLSLTDLSGLDTPTLCTGTTDSDNFTLCQNAPDTSTGGIYGCWWCMEYGGIQGWPTGSPSAWQFLATQKNQPTPKPTPPIVAPNKCPGCSEPNQTAQQCATDIANQFSIAGLLPGAPGTGNSFGGGFVGGLLGNNVSNVTTLYNVIFHGDNPVPFAGGVAAGGPGLGLVTSGAPVGAQGPVAATLGQLAPKAVGEFLDAAFLPKRNSISNS